MRKIDLETHFYTEDYLAYLRSRTKPPRQEVEGDVRRTWFEPSVPEIVLASTRELEDPLLDIGGGRVAGMDEAGIDVQILSLSGPGVEQFEPDASLEWAKRINDELAEAVARHPTRLVGYACLAPAKAEESADELERCVTKLGFRGANIFSHVGEHYLDERRFWPIFETAERLDVPIYLHPTIPHGQMIKPYLGYGWGLPSAALGFGAEAAVHAMRLILSGLFDEYPNLHIMLGHFGEALQHWVYRMDHDFVKTWLDDSARRTLERRPSEVLKQNFWVNCSGNFLYSALTACLMEWGPEHVAFASDWPWERMEVAVRFIEEAPLEESDREKICWRNAEELYGLAGTPAGAGAAAQPA